MSAATRIYRFYAPGAKRPSFVEAVAAGGAAEDAARAVLKWMGARSFSLVKQPVDQDYWWAEFDVDGERVSFWVVAVEGEENGAEETNRSASGCRGVDQSVA